MSVLLWAATFASCALSQWPLPAEAPFWSWPALLWQAPHAADGALLFACGVMAVLSAHELGHMLVAHRYGVRHGRPLFLPAPTLFGTLGAIMPMQSLAPHRRALLHISAAGPLCGFAVAAPLYLFGLVQGPQHQGAALMLGDSWATRALQHVARGGWGAEAHVLLAPSPWALSGWLGLFWTGLNLTPMGQLDGGHVLYAAFGGGHRRASAAVATGLVLSFSWLVLAAQPISHQVWQGALVWPLLAACALLLGARHEGVSDGGARGLSPVDRLLVVFVVAVWLATFVAVPLWPQATLSLGP